MKKLVVVFLTMMMILVSSCEKEKEFDRKIQPDLIDVARTMDNGRTCSTNQHQENLLEDREYRARFIARKEAAERMIRLRGDEPCTSPIILPIAIHFQGVQQADKACLVALAMRQVETLNLEFIAKNSDISLWNSVQLQYPNVSLGEACVQFCLATKFHPDGYDLQEGEPAVTINKTTGDVDANWSGYINIFVQSNTGVLGYSPLGGVGNGDGIVIDAEAFGSGSGCGAVSPQAPFNLGRTLTHEMGHYLFLDHLWGEEEACYNDDEVSDTPNQEEPHFGCPDRGVASCGSTDLYMSYMDYTNDECMYMFSKGQASRMQNYVQANLQALIAKADETCGEGSGGGGGNGGEESCEYFKMILNITLDDYPEETTWILWGESDDEIEEVELATGGPFEEMQYGETISDTFCLEDGCYFLEIIDLWGDGICCDYGEGEFEIIDGDGEELYYSDGDFGSYDGFFICIEDGVQVDFSHRRSPKAEALKSAPAKPSRRPSSK